MPSSKSSVDKRDVYYRKGKSEGYRARSAYKLLHLDEEFDLFRGVSTAVDLCAAPGSWSQVLGQKLKPGKEGRDAKVVSIDLQPMAPLPNITVLQRDITLPSTVPLVLDALGGRKADLVICDGAPDVTGVHDLDAYLHSQLLLAALTLSLTLLAPGSTLIFKIFLSPLDPKAAFLRSQLREFFPGPSDTGATADPSAFAEFNDESEPSSAAEDGSNEASEIRNEAESEKQPSLSAVGYDLVGRRGGVWARKPRSSRKGSGEAFIVCRNFDPKTVPLPITFSAAALDKLREATGTLTLESLASLGGIVSVTDKWNRIKGYVESGDLDTTTPSGPYTRSKISTNPGGIQLQIQTDTQTIDRLFDSHPTAIESTTGTMTSLFPPTTSADAIVPGIRSSGLKTTLSASPSMRRALAANHRRRTSTDSNGSETSPTSTTSLRPWDRAPSPLPSPMGWPNVTESNNLDLDRNDGDAPSPALSTSSKTELFFAASQLETLPVPPKAFTHASALGRGTSPSRGERDRAGSTPVVGLSSQSQVSSRQQIQLVLPDHRHVHRPAMRAVSTPVPSRPPKSPRLPTERLGDRIPSPPLSSHPTLPQVAPSPNPNQATDSPISSAAFLKGRESQFKREQREIVIDDRSLIAGDVLVPFHEPEEEPVAAHHGDIKWRLVELMGEGAFSGVWSAIPQLESATNSTASPSSPLAAIKIMSKRVCSTDSRTRIAFVREVEVLRHISHPNIVAFLSSFSTTTHHCLVLELLPGGELFDLVSKEENKRRMLIPGLGDEKGEGFVRRVFGELCTAVAWLHEVGVVHRDIKMENILFTINPFTLPPTSTGSIPLNLLPRPLVKLTDFGLSRFINISSPMLATRCGSENFAAPEIIMGRMYDGRLTDAWATGVVLYALLAGELPFDQGSPVLGNGSRPRASSGATTPANGVIDNGETMKNGGGGGVDERRKRMMRIAKGEYAWRSGIGTEKSRAIVAKLLVRDPAKRCRVLDLWNDEWMKGPGSVEKPDTVGQVHVNEDISQIASSDLSLRLGVGQMKTRQEGRKVWAGHVLDDVGDMARAESFGADGS